MSAADTVPAFVKVAPLFTVMVLWAIVFPAALSDIPSSTREPSPVTEPVFVSAPVIVPLLLTVPALFRADVTVPSFVNVTALFTVIFPCVMLISEALLEFPLSVSEPSPVIVPLFVRLPVIRPALAISDSFLTAPVRLPSAVFVRVPESTVILSAVTAPSFPKLPLNDTLLWAIVFPAALLPPLTDIIPVPVIVPLFSRLPVIRPALAIVDSFFTAPSRLPSAVFVRVPASTVILSAVTAPSFSKSPLNDTLLWAIVFPAALLPPLMLMIPVPLIVPLFTRLPVIRPALAIADSFFILSAVTLPAALTVSVPASTVTSVASTAPLLSKSPLNDTLLWAIVFPAALLPPFMLMIPVPLIVPLFTRLPVIRPALAIVESFLTAPSRLPSVVFVRVPASTVMSSAVTVPLFSKLPLNDTLLWAIVFPAALLPLTSIIPVPLIVPLFIRLPVIRPALAIVDSFLTAPVRLPSAVFVSVPASTVILSAVTAPLFSKLPLNDTLLWAIVFSATLLPPLIDITPVPVMSFALSPPLKFSVPLFTIPLAIDNAEASLVSSLLIVSTFCVMLPLLTTLLLLIVTAPVPVTAEEIVPPIRLRRPSLAISVTMRLSAFETTVAEAISTFAWSMICAPTVSTSVAISGV